MTAADEALLQGWINIGVQAAVAFGTLVLAVLAIWGDQIRHWLTGPKLSLRLYSVEGELNTTNNGVKTRYYHYYLKNNRSHAPSQNVKVMLLGVYRPGPDGRFHKDSLISPIQFTYQFYFASGHDPRPTVGSPVQCDIGSVAKDAPFIFSTYLRPNNFDSFVRPNQKVRVHARAEGDNATSNDVYIEVAWDGTWDDGAAEMQKHLVVREVESPTE